MKEFQVETEVGKMKVGMTPELQAAMLSLSRHPGWKLYAAMIRSYGQKVFESLRTAPQEEYAKRIGKADGLYLSVDFLDQAVREIEKQQDRLVAAESTKQSDSHR